MKEIGIFLLIFMLAGCTPRSGANSEDPNESETDSLSSLTDLTARAEEFADSVLKTLTIEEKIGQCFMPSIFTSADAYTMKYYQKLIDDYKIGGILLAKGDVESAKIISEKAGAAKVPLFVSIDAEWGVGMRLEDATVFPKNGNIRTDAEETLLFDYGREVGRECREYGINMVLGPVVDIVERRGGAIGSRSFGNDAQRVANMGVAYAKGLESVGIISVAKHFPGQGSSIADSHQKMAPVYKNISALDSVDFFPFRLYIKSGLSGVMAGHIQLLAVNPEGEPATVSSDILTTLLRDEMKFQGLVLTDAFSMGGAHGFSSYEAIEAGADIVLCPDKVEKEIQKVIGKVNSGELSESVIDDRCRRILFYKSLFGLWHPERASEISEKYYQQKEKLIEALQNSPSELH